MPTAEQFIIGWILYYLSKTDWLKDTEYPRNVYGGLGRLNDYVTENSDIFTEKEFKANDQQEGT